MNSEIIIDRKTEMNILVILNEAEIGLHDDVHRAFSELKLNNIIKDYTIYSFLAHLKSGKSEEQVNNEIIDIAQRINPELILWMHTPNFNVSNNTIKKLRETKNKPVMGYWDGDLYESPYRPTPKCILSLSSQCDVVFLQGYNEVAELMHRKGAKDIRYVPPFGDKRFYTIKRSEKNLEYDVVMIGSNIKSRNPLRPSMSGTKLRSKIVKYFYKKLGNKFAVYGNGWKGNFAKGPIDYAKQSEVYHKSKIAIRVNNYKGKYYFSDGLPIAMLSGIPLIHNYEEGYNELWSNNPGIKFFKSVDEAWEMTELLLNKNLAELNEIGYNLSKYALNNLTHFIVFKYITIVLKYLYQKNKGQKDVVEIKNYWGVKAFTE